MTIFILRSCGRSAKLWHPFSEASVPHGNPKRIPTPSNWTVTH